MGGFVAAAQPIVDLLRQRARPYLFSNSLAPPVAAGALKALEIAIRADDRRARLEAHAKRFRAGLEAAGFKTLPGVTPIIPVMLGEARARAGSRGGARRRGVYVAGFFFPVVPKGQARIRTQMSAALTTRTWLARSPPSPRRAASSGSSDRPGAAGAREERRPWRGNWKARSPS